jgi:hypothetical protein
LNKIFLILILLIQLDEEKIDETGIYLPIKCTRHDTKYRVLLTSKEVCLAGKPIISSTGFSNISNLIQLNDQIYFDITFSQKAFGVLRKLNESFPYTDLALVIEGEVFFVFTAADRKLNQTFRFQSDLKNEPHFRRIHSKLANLVKE